MLAAPLSLSVEQAARLEVRVVELERVLADYASRYGLTDEARRLLAAEPRQPSEEAADPTPSPGGAGDAP